MAGLALTSLLLNPPDHAHVGNWTDDLAAERYIAVSSEEHRLVVPLDWASPSAHTSFSIRFHVDLSSFTAANDSAPIFLQMGGEGSVNYARCSSTAQRHGAICAAVEHRFYGKSFPRRRAGRETIWAMRKGLFVKQALADAAAVVDAVQALVPTQDGRRRLVIAQGGSYSGALCAWFAQAYPRHVAACVAASAVVNAELDLEAFDVLVARALGAGPCRASLHKAQRQFDSALLEGSGDFVRRLFGAEGFAPGLGGDVDLAYAVADGAAMAVQYGGKAELCAALAKVPIDAPEPAHLVALAAFYDHHYGKGFAGGCFYNRRCLAVEGRSPWSASFSEADSNARSWRFQKCHEVGFLQRIPGTLSSLPRLRSKLLTLPALVRQCRAVFKTSPLVLHRRNAILNHLFGGADPVSGAYPEPAAVYHMQYSDDPWRAAAPDFHARGVVGCYLQCDGCGHCGAGVPQRLRKRCDAGVDAFVDRILLRGPERPWAADAHAGPS